MEFSITWRCEGDWVSEWNFRSNQMVEEEMRYRPGNLKIYFGKLSVGLCLLICFFKFQCIRTILWEHEAHFCSKFKNNPALAKEQSLKFWVQVVSKTATSAAQLAKCILLQAYSRTTASSQLRENKQKLHSLFNKLA